MKLLTVYLLLFTFGCASNHGVKISDTKYQEVVEGKTTLAQLKAALGEPQSVMEDVIQKKYVEQSMIPKICGSVGDRVTAYIYNYTESSLSHSSIEMKRFLVGKDGIVCFKQSNKHGI